MTLKLNAISTKFHPSVVVSSNFAWWMGILVILLVGIVLRYTGYNYQLPYVSNNDEAMSLAQTLHLRGLYLQTGQIPGYPPGVFVVQGLAQRIGEVLTGQSTLENPSLGLQITRIFANFTSLLNIMVIGMLAKRLAGPIAGLLAALIWLVLPTYIEHSSRALAEAWLLLFWTLALYWAIIAYEESKPAWAVFSVIAGFVSFVFKYNAFLAVAVGFSITAWKLLRVRHERRRWFLAAIAQVLCVGLALFLLFFVVYNGRDALNTGDSDYALHQGGLDRFLSLPMGLNEVNISISEFRITPLWIPVLILCLGTWLYITHSKRNNREDRLFIWTLLLGLATLWAWTVSAYASNDVNLVSQRYVLPTTLVFSLLLAVSITLCGEWLSQRIRQPWINLLVAMVFFVTWVLPTGFASWQIAEARTMPDTHSEVQQWAAQMLGDGAVLVDRSGFLVFNKEWGGYPGAYRVGIERDITSRPLTDWLKDHVNYALIAGDQLHRLEQSLVGKDYLRQLLLMRQFPPPGQELYWTGPQLTMYRLWPAQYLTDYAFGQAIRLTGYDLDTMYPKPGQALHLTLYWKATSQPGPNYNVFIHLVKLNDYTPVSQVDGPPAGLKRPTQSWTDPSETLISGTLQLQVPENLPTGTYRLIMGLYDYETGQRMPTKIGDFVELTKLYIGSEIF